MEVCIKNIRTADSDIIGRWWGSSQRYFPQDAQMSTHHGRFANQFSAVDA